MSAKVEVILCKAADWDEWIMVIQNMTLKDDLFSLINPDVSPEPVTLAAPVRPTMQSMFPDQTFDTMTDRHFRALDYALKDYADADRKYVSQSERLEKVMVYINSHVQREHLLQIQGCRTVWQALVALKKHLAPTDRARQIETVYRYRQAQNPPHKQDQTKWLLEWEKAYNDAVRIGLPEVQDDRPVQDFLFTLRSVDAAFAAGREASMAERLKLGVPMFTVKELIEDFRNHMRLNQAVVAPAERTTKGHRAAFGASFNGEDQQANTKGNNTKNERKVANKRQERSIPKCLCGEVHWFRECPYLIMSARPANWKADPETQRHIDDTLSSSENLQNAVDRAKQHVKEHEAVHATKEQDAKKNSQNSKNSVPRAPSAGSFCTIIGAIPDRDKKSAPSSNSICHITHATPNLVEDNASVIYQTDTGMDLLNNISHPDEKIQYSVAFAVDTSYKLVNCWTLDSGTDIHVCNDPKRFKREETARRGVELLAGKTTYQIEAFGTVDITVDTPEGAKTVTLLDVALAPGFLTSLVCLRRFTRKGVHWDTENERLHQHGVTFCYTQDVGDHWVLENREPCAPINPAGAFAASSRDPKRAVEATATKWHEILGHAGQEAISHLEENVEGATVKGTAPNTTECDTCALTKAHELVSRRNSQEIPVTKPFERVGWDLISMTTAYNGDKWVSHFTCFVTTFDVVYTHPRKNDALAMFDDFLRWVYANFGTTVNFIRMDNEQTLGNAYTALTSAWGITTERSAPYTPAQNGRTERAGGVLIARARALRIKANMPADMWPEAIKTAGYLNNRIPRRSLEWKTPFEALYGHKPNLSHLHIFGSKAFALQHNMPRKDKMEPRALIGYLTGFDSTNVYRVWIPSRGKVIRTRDVTFRDSEHYDPMAFDAGHIQSTESNMLIQTIQLPDPYVAPLPLVEQDNEATPAQDNEATTALADVAPGGIHEHEQDCAEATNDPDEEFQMASEVPMLPTPENTPEPTEAKSSDTGGHHASQESKGGHHAPQDSTPSIPEMQDSTALSEHHQMPNLDTNAHTAHTAPISAKARDISADFDTANILPTRTRRRQAHAAISSPSSSSLSSFHGAFATGLSDIPKQVHLHRDSLPVEPQSWKHMIKHKFANEFREAAKREISALKKQQTFELVPKDTEMTPIPLTWVFKYKFDTDGYLEKFKARLCVRGDLQSTQEDTYAATLAARTFRALVSISAAFDLEMRQYDAVNAFVNSELKERVHTFCPEGFATFGHCWELRKALYGLKQAPLRWHQTLSDALEKLGLHEVPGVNCLFTNDWLTLFFYVDDIVALCKTHDLPLLARFERDLTQRFEMKVLGDLKWFLGIRIVRNRDQRKIWLTQDSYINKIAAKFAQTEKNVKTPCTTAFKLESSTEAPSPKRTLEYQQKIGSVNFAAVISRPDIAFAVSSLSRYLQNPSHAHMQAADRVIAYLHSTRFLSLEYSGARHSDIFMCASDAAFADNEDRHSSDGYLFQLFGGPIDWKAAKQRTVTTSSTEAELLALSRAAKETL
jgi:Reverse transcriptase (RNA-dependent DNA polymerase)